jgi:hypothetical protein
MRFPNLAWALCYQRLQHFRFAELIGVNEARFSRGLNGRLEFTPAERERISKMLGFSETWLFAEPCPPRIGGLRDAAVEPVAGKE